MRMMGDLISRDALRKAFHYRIKFFNKSDFDKAMLIIDSVPAVRKKATAEERPRGEWIAVYFSREELNVPQKASVFDFVKCPFCETIHQGRHHFCSWCGADMRGKDYGS